MTSTYIVLYTTRSTVRSRTFLRISVTSRPGRIELTAHFVRGADPVLLTMTVYPLSSRLFTVSCAEPGPVGAADAGAATNTAAVVIPATIVAIFANVAMSTPNSPLDQPFIALVST